MERLRQWRLANPELYRSLVRASTQLRRYGLSPDDYVLMLEAQGGTCALPSCTKRPENGLHGRLHVDHDHATGEVRGLLCFNHNAMLGQAKDNWQDLIEGAQYLMLPPARVLPPTPVTTDC